MRPYQLTLAKSSIPLVAIFSLFFTGSFAQNPDDTELIELEAFEVSEQLQQRLTELQLASPNSTVGLSELQRLQEPSLGAVLAWQPGVGSSSFGAGANRPVIRGFSGKRVRVLEDGLTTGDVSDISPDHAVTIEPLFLRQVEIVRGPATLFYGNAAIGGAVDVTTARFPTLLAKGENLEGALNFSYESVAEEKSAATANTIRVGSFGAQVNAMVRRSEDYAIPGKARREDVPLGHSHGNDATEEPNPSGTLPNSFVDTEQGSVGFGWLDEATRLAFAVSTYRSRYGVPFHSHATELGDAQTEVSGAEIDLANLRYDLLLERSAPIPGFSEMRFRYGYFHYEHDEIDGGIPQTRFINQGHELRLELYHEPIFHRLRGALGVQFSEHEFDTIVRDQDFAGLMPPTQARNQGVFLLESLDVGPVRLQMGGRYEEQENDPLPAYFDFAGNAEERYYAASWSFGADFTLPAGFFITVGRMEAERAPTPGELFANGLHLALGVFEWGSFFGNTAGPLEEEKVRHYDLSFGRTGRWIAFTLTGFYSDFSNYIFLRRTEFDTNTGLPIFEHVERPAEVYGYEATAEIFLKDFTGWPVSLYLQSDYVYGSFERPIEGLTETGFVIRPLPKIPPRRYLVRLEWDDTRITAGVEARHAEAQERVDLNSETATPAYTLVNADVAWRTKWLGQNITIRGRITNAFDEEARNHLSFLKDVVPQPGRSLGISLEVAY